MVLDSMARVLALALVTGGAGAALVPTAAAADKVSCGATAVAYRGPALHAPVALPAIPGDLTGLLDADPSARLREALEAARKSTGAPSITAAVAIPGKGLWTPDGADAPLHYWASAGKTFVAIVILQLMEEGKLRLEDPVSKWIAKVPNGDAITVEQLLAHTSGLFSANEDLQVRKARRYHTPEENLAVARKQGPLFCPGERWRYSNTGYDLLGEIIARVDGRPFPAAITARILTPLGLKRMRALTPGAAVQDVAPLTSAKEAPIDPSWPGAAGAIVGSAADMVRVWHALLSHRLVKEETLRRMVARLYPMFTPIEFYGLGVMLFDVPEKDGATRQWIGHAGGAPGVGALVAWSPSDNAIVAVALTGDGSAPATVNLLLRRLREQKATGAADAVSPPPAALARRD